MKTTPLRIDTSFFHQVRPVAEIMNRTPTAQVEFWAKLGRVVEAALSVDSVARVKRLARADDLDAIMAAARGPGGQEIVLQQIRMNGVPVYSEDAFHPGLVVETLSDGSSRRGRFVNRRFEEVPDAS